MVKLHLIPELERALEAFFLMISREGIPPEQCQLVAAYLISEAVVKSAVYAPVQAIEEAEFREEDLTA